MHQKRLTLYMTSSIRAVALIAFMFDQSILSSSMNERSLGLVAQK